MPQADAMDVDGFVNLYAAYSDKVKLMKDRKPDPKIGRSKSVKKALKSKHKAWKRYLEADAEQALELFHV